MNHATTRATILPTIIRLISKTFEMSEDDALRIFYESATGAAFADDETGLYSQSSNYIFSLFLHEKGKL